MYCAGVHYCGKGCSSQEELSPTNTATLFAIYRGSSNFHLGADRNLVFCHIEIGIHGVPRQDGRNTSARNHTDVEDSSWKGNPRCDLQSQEVLEMLR